MRSAVEQPDWASWHKAYDDRSSSLAERLRIVQARLRNVLDTRAGRTTRIVSACAGEGRDVIEVVAAHPARELVEISLVERSAEVADKARRAALGRGLRNVAVVEGDAGHSGIYRDLVPADVLLFCGVFGWITDADVFRTVDFLPRLAAAGATVIWTRHHRPPDRTGPIRERFEAAGFDEIAFVTPANSVSSIGVHRLAGRPLAFVPNAELFRF